MWRYNYSNELYHYGVIGMKWGKRKAQSGSSYVSTSARQKQITKEYKQAKKNTPRSQRKQLKSQYQKDINATYNKKYTAIDRGIDKQQFGKKGVNRINDRMNRGDSYMKAQLKEITRQTATGYAVGAAMLATPAIANMTVSKMSKYANQKAIQRANAGLTRIGTFQYEKVAGDVYRTVMK